MKAVKIFLIITFVTITLMSFSSAKYNPGKTSMNIALETAMLNPSLFYNMYYQIGEDLIDGEQQGYYVANVTLLGKTYYIYATLNDWQEYFNMPIWVNDGSNNKPIKIDRYTY